ncbi:MAG: L,D-transpeptidase [Sandaracinaceae bacterium]|nr:L,D-transpeptidase [Sandaracinaceae bacterium]
MRAWIAPVTLAVALGCGGDDATTPTASAEPATAGERAVAALPPEATEAEREAARIDADFPKHAAVTGTLIVVRTRPDEGSPVVGWLRVGSRIRVGTEVRQGPGCRTWRTTHPLGWVCDDDSLDVRDEVIEVEEPTLEGWKEDQVEQATARGALVLPATARDAPMPYDYWYVRDSTVPEYHRLPSRDEQRAATAKSDRYRELFAIDERRARRYLAGESDDGPRGTAVVSRYLDRGFYVASTGVEVRAFRRFVRTTQGRYVKQANLETRNGHTFQGVELGPDRALPVAWTVRTSRPMVRGEDGAFTNEEEAEPIERQTLLTGWQERRNLGGQVMHVLETDAGPRYLRAWFAAVAERIDRPEGVAEDEPWVHVDLSEQTLVLYEGDTPVYATLVSTGVEDNATPTGLFEIRRKHVTDTMSNIGADAGDDRYSIEDVPWTQYFEGAFALHTAFWHTGFGLPRSHGCVNMTPFDAHYVFGRTWPRLPDGWHGVATEQTELRGSHVLVTD